MLDRRNLGTYALYSTWLEDCLGTPDAADNGSGINAAYLKSGPLIRVYTMLVLTQAESLWSRKNTNRDRSN